MYTRIDFEYRLCPLPASYGKIFLIDSTCMAQFPVRSDLMIVSECQSCPYTAFTCGQICFCSDLQIIIMGLQIIRMDFSIIRLILKSITTFIHRTGISIYTLTCSISYLIYTNSLTFSIPVLFWLSTVNGIPNILAAVIVWNPLFSSRGHFTALS